MPTEMIRQPSGKPLRAAILIAAVAPMSPAYAHAFGQRYDLPLPLWLFVTGAGAAVALSFAVVAWFLRGAGGSYPRLNLLRWRLGRALAHPALLGDVWALINPWKILFGWVESVYRRLRPGRELSLGLAYPVRLGVWPAVALFAVFAWAELIWHGRDLPERLAVLLLVYSVITWLGMIAFGKELWLRRGEVFSLVFGLLARFSPTEVRVRNPDVCRVCSAPCARDEDGCLNCYACFARAAADEREWNLRPYAVGLIVDRPVSVSLMALVLLMLSTVTFDGFRETPPWVRVYDLLLTTPSLRSVLIDLHRAGLDIATVVDTLGLVAFPLVFFLVYMAFNVFMRLVIGGASPARRLARAFVLTLIPIAIAYHLAHYLSYLFTVGQYVIPLASDPFGFGWDLLGTKLYFIRIGIIDARFAWYTAVIAIVVGHIAAVYLAHVIALGLLTSRRLALRSQIPMLVLMVGYTMVSLWILAQPIVEPAAVASRCGTAAGRAEWRPLDPCLRATYPRVATRA